MTWRRDLDVLQKNFTNWIFTNWMLIPLVNKASGLADVNQRMQALYPGPYSVIEKFDPRRGLFVLDLEFASPQARTLWLLKWS